STLKEVIFLDDFQYGSLTKISGRYQYTPFPDIKDVVETVRYTLLDNSKLKSNISTLTIHIYKTEAIAVDDSFKTGYNFVRTLRLLDNDYAQGSKINPSSIIIHKPAENGTVRVRTNGTVEYIPNHLFTGTDFFEYQVADLNGNFSAPARVIIEVKGFVIPNIITPNDDNVNDAFFIIGANSFDKIELQVRDRFGIEIFSSTDYKNDWIPTEDIADGTYYYVLKFHKKCHKPAVRKGHILIVRSRYNM
ncbi:MAG TPA: gliding motility-associated C-terminal domain-containing protein, partial [Sphingobacterium sp.]|nr:gliding motility-associated C-terminal domain-containing protein [Sphingobacterium sp.]